MVTKPFTTPFWQTHDYIRNRAYKLITENFGEKPSFNISLIIAQIVNDSGAIIDKSYPEKEVWLHEKIFKLLATLLDHNHQLIAGKLGTLPDELEKLATLETKLHALKVNLPVAPTEHEYETFRNAYQAG
jgi:hypothetical protein